MPYEQTYFYKKIHLLVYLRKVNHQFFRKISLPIIGFKGILSFELSITSLTLFDEFG